MLPTRQLRGATSTLAYLVLLRVEIARFTPAGLPCGTPTGLVSVALILTLGSCDLSVERCYLLRCPVQSGRSSSAPFRVLLRGCTSDGLARFTPVLSVFADPAAEPDVLA